MSTLGDLLGITRPLILFDLETTSLRPTMARILSLGMRVHKPGEDVHVYHTFVNPGVPISPESTVTHGITDETIRVGCGRCGQPVEGHGNDHPWKPIPTFADIAESLLRGFSDADFGGYNVRYDLAVTVEEFKRLSMTFDYSKASILDAVRLWQKLDPRTLSDAVEYFLKRKMQNAHHAAVDIEETEAVLIAELTTHARSSELPRNVAALHALCFPPDPNAIDAARKFVFIDGVPSFNFGQHNGKPMASQRGYLKWMVEKGEFHAETKRVAMEALSGVFPRQEEK